MCCGHKPRLAKLLQIWKTDWKRKVLISVEVVCAEERYYQTVVRCDNRNSSECGTEFPSPLSKTNVILQTRIRILRAIIRLTISDHNLADQVSIHNLEVKISVTSGYNDAMYILAKNPRGAIVGQIMPVPSATPARD